MMLPFPRARVDRGEAGFTLIEVLVSLGLLAGTVAMIAASIASTRLATATVERLSKRSVVTAAQDYLRSAIMQTQTFSGNVLPTKRSLNFDGKATELNFITSYSPLAHVRGLYRVSVNLIASSDHPGLYDLIASQTLFRLADDDEAGEAATITTTATLFPGIETVNFAYFGEKDEAEGGDWLETWSQREGLPSLVRIEVVLSKGDDRQWPVLKVQLPSSEPVSIACPRGSRCS